MRNSLFINEKFTGLDLSFKSYIQLTERHTTIRRSIANLAKIGLREIVEDVFNNRYKKANTVLYGMFFSRQRALQEFLEDTEPNNESPVANCTIQGLLGNRHVSIPFDLYLVSGNFPSGKFDAKKKRVIVYIDKSKLDYLNIPEFVFETLVHEITHYYQHVAKNSRQKEMLILDDMPEMFSYTAYVLLPEEVEARIASMYEKWRRNSTLKKQTFFRTMLYLLSYSVYDAGDDYTFETPPVNYVKKLEQDQNYYEAFITKYFLACGITKTRYYKYVKDDKDYKAFIKAFNPDKIENIKSLFNGVYQYCKSVFPQAYDTNEDAYEMFSVDSKQLKYFFNSYQAAINMAKKLQNEAENELNAA